MKPAVTTECGKTMMKVMQGIYFHYLRVAVNLKQEASKHNRLSSLVLSFHVANLCFKPLCLMSWVAETREKLQDTVCARGMQGIKCTPNF